MTDNPNQSNAPAWWRPLLSPLLIVVAAIVYYGLYLRFWFNPHDEGGTAALTAQRLLAGEVPMRDVELGYNVMWFWPIVALFKIGGINFLLMRAYFFALSTLTALGGWNLVRRVTRNEWLALGVGLVLVVFPGSQFKNYNPLLCIANMLCLVQAALAPVDVPARFWRRAAIGGLVLGMSLLVRIDIGYLFALMWLGIFVLRLCDARLPARARWGDTATAAAVLAAGVLVPHAPVYLAARAQGFDQRFVREYPGKVNYMAVQAGLKPPFAGMPNAPVPGKPRDPAKVTLAAPKSAPPAAPQPVPSGKRRMGWDTLHGLFAGEQLSEADRAVLHDKAALFALTYLPFFAYVALLAAATFLALGALRRRDFTLDHPAVLTLVLLGSSLTTFPQFFFFRPDRPHLSEFMPGYIVATVCAAVLLCPRGPRVLRWTAGVFLGAQFALYGWFALDHYSAGTIAARTTIKPAKRKLFEGANGVRVVVSKKEFEVLDGVRRAIVENAQPSEWVVCYPYQPGYNIMTNRPTYERDIYMDNATAPRGWARQAINRIAEKRPAVIVLDNRAINGDDNSRFSRWAAPVDEYVRKNYRSVGRFEASEIFARDPLPESK